MNTEHTIKYFEDAIRESDEDITDCTPELQEQLAEQKRHFETALVALRVMQERENPQPLTIEEFQAERAEAHFSGKERWLWCVMGSEAGWKKVSTLAKWGNFSQYGKAWVTYRHQPKEAAE